MTLQRLAIIVGILIVLILGVWGFVNLTPFMGNLLGGPTGKVVINNQTITYEIADTDEKRELGLSGKKSLSEDRGMVFLFPSAAYPSFWMKEMQFPIDIIFMNEGTITTIYKDVQPPASDTAPLPLYKPTTPSNRVLELNAGKAEELGLTVGQTLEMELPTK